MSAPACLKRHYPSGPRNAYAYTYADPREVGPRQPLQLEFWIPKGRKGGSWVHHYAAPSQPGGHKTWRRVIPGHSHADKLAHSIGAVKAGYARDIEGQIKGYLVWARAHGLTSVHAFKGCKIAPKWAPNVHIELVPVDPAEFIGPAPSPEADEVSDVAA